MKIGRERLEVRAAFERDGDRCVACGFDLPCALAAHHKLPREHGGRDSRSNLTVLCANCHKLVHWLSVGGRLEGPEVQAAMRAYQPAAFAMLKKLAMAIRIHRIRTRESGNRWVEGKSTQGLIPWADALNLLARRNHFDEGDTRRLKDVSDHVLRRIPADVRSACSIRLIQRGRFLSVNAGNVLIFRTPGFPDGGRKPDNDVYLIWPEDTRISVLSRAEWRQIAEADGTFARLPCFDLLLSFEETLKMSRTDWVVFARVCREAMKVGKTRHWVSNVALPPGLRR
jgi:HNH endonuclease